MHAMLPITRLPPPPQKRKTKRCVLVAAQTLRANTDWLSWPPMPKILKPPTIPDMASSFIDRLTLDGRSHRGHRQRVLKPLPPCQIRLANVIAEWRMPNGLEISRVRTPLGVIGIIYESRPNVTADAGALVS